nr:hypothetical protein [Tanacetum cinerariifolium]
MTAGRTESKEHDTSSSSGIDAHDDGADISPIYDEESMAKVQTTAKINVFAIGQYHTEQPKFNNEREVVQNAKECHDTCPVPAVLTDNQIPEHSYQSLESENICLKKTVAQFQKDFSRMEAHCVNLELKCQNNVLKEGQQSQFLKENSNEANVKHDIDNLVPNLSESEDECECDVPDCDDSQMINFSTFSNPIFDDSTSSDDESSHEEVIHEMSFKTYSNPLFDLDEEIISSEFNLIHNEDLDSTPKNDRFDPKSYLLESLLNRDTLMASSPKFDSLLEEFSEFNSKNSDAIIKSFSPSPISVEDIDPFMEEINLFLTSDGSIPPGINSDYSDSEWDNLFLERLLHDDPIPLLDILDFLNVI